jgi:hypothetical protein
MIKINESSAAARSQNIKQAAAQTTVTVFTRKSEFILLM